MNWRGRPLTSHEVIVSLIGATTNRKGLKVRAHLDTGSYPKGVKVTDAELAAVPLTPHEFHGKWNYTVRPQRGRQRRHEWPAGERMRLGHSGHRGRRSR